MPVKARFFAKPADFRSWLEKNHASARELWVGFHKVHTGKPSLTWPQSVDEALCFGWIDGLRKGLGADAYMIRFSPRRPTSVWSNVNTRRVGELEKLGLMRPAGLAAFKLRDDLRSAKVYSLEARQVAFDPATEKTFRRNRAAWEFFNTQPPGYRRIVTRWVMTAKRDETRATRLAELIRDSAEGRRAGVTTRYSRR
ncbi:MAG TPA: YdeI/OmpD-associated family protein [Usitatibacter sp.]|nr:YdeI/OmpD-associated family protein [Usitatibacter sp.]